MGEPGSQRAPDGVTVDDVSWLPSGARSGIVRVQGARPPAADVPLPRLLVRGADGERGYDSLPDTAAAGPTGWRGAYVVEATRALEATDLVLVWPSGEAWSVGPLWRPELPANAGSHLSIVASPEPELEAVVSPDEPVASAAAGPDDPGAEVVDRAVLAERRAGRAEAAATIHATTAHQALEAIEALELRSAALAEDLEGARAERDALRARVEPTAPAGPSPREAALEQALAERRAALDALHADMEARALEAPPSDEAQRRAAALTQALTEAVTDVDVLRTDLHEQLVLRRTRDVEAAADRVALVTLVRDLDALRAAADAARAEAALILGERDAARVALEQQRAETAGAQAAHDETRRRFTERVAELREARGRIAELEGELAAARDEAGRVESAHAAEVAAVRGQAEEAARVAAERLAAAQAEAARLGEDARAVAAMRAEVGRAQAALRRAETAREVAVASALAARAQRQADAVAHAGTAPERVAALEAEVVRLRAVAANAPASDDAGPGLPAAGEPSAAEPALPGPVPAPADVIARAAEQVRIAAERRAATPADPGRVIADLDAAAAALRRSALSPEGHEPPVGGPADVSATEAPPAHPDAAPAADAAPPPAETASTDDPEARRRPTITPGPASLPGDIARGRGGRSYPPLRGGLVKLAHDDPRAAATLLAGLARGLHAAAPDTFTLDLSLDELDRPLAVDVGPDGTTTEELQAPRARRAARIAVRTDAVTLAETLAGVDHRPRRRGALRAVRGRRRARGLAVAVVAAGAPLPDLVRAGAQLDPVLALRAFAYAVPPAWTRGHRFAVRVVVADASVTIRATDGGGLEADVDPGAASDATATFDRVGFDALLVGDDGGPADAGPEADTLRDWARRLGALPG